MGPFMFPFPAGVKQQPASQIPRTLSMKEEREMRRAIEEEREANAKYFKDNRWVIDRAYKGKYITVHKSGARGRIVTADETEEARARYLDKLSDFVRQGAYVPSGRLEEEVDEFSRGI